MVSTTVINTVRDYMDRLKESGLPVSFAVLFGSYAVGTPHEYSDIDILVVSPQFDHRIERRWVNHLWRVAARTDSRIEPIPCGTNQWEEDHSSPIIEIARSEGQKISAG